MWKAVYAGAALLSVGRGNGGLGFACQKRHTEYLAPTSTVGVKLCAPLTFGKLPAKQYTARSGSPLLVLLARFRMPHYTVNAPLSPTV